MKSLLQEGSSVNKALALAWETAGKPKEFTVKILEIGSTNFFGFTKKPAIVSIFFDPVVEASTQSRSSYSSLADGQEHGRNSNRSKPQPTTRQAAPRNDRTARPLPAQPRQNPRHELNSELEVKSESSIPVIRELRESEAWTTDTVHDITSLLTDTLSMMHSDVEFVTTTDKQLLTIIFSRQILPEAEAERMLYASLSYLFIQLMKKKNKKRYKGFRLLFASK